WRAPRDPGRRRAARAAFAPRRSRPCRPSATTARPAPSGSGARPRACAARATPRPGVAANSRGWPCGRDERSPQAPPPPPPLPAVSCPAQRLDLADGPLRLPARLGARVIGQRLGLAGPPHLLQPGADGGDRARRERVVVLAEVGERIERGARLACRLQGTREV